MLEFEKKSDVLPYPHVPLTVSTGVVTCSDDAGCDVVDCDAAKISLEVTPKITGKSYIVWSASQLLGASPDGVLAQIEFARSGVTASCAWQVVRPYAVDTGIWRDPGQRVYGSSDDGYYRVVIKKIVDGEETIYRSRPVRSQDYVPSRVRPAYLEVIRRWELRGRTGEIRRGQLLKKIRYGQRCIYCRDPESGVKTKSQCLACYGSGWYGGFFPGSDCTYAELGPVSETYNLSKDRSYFTDGPTTTAKLLGIPHIYPGDLWVESETDHRWEIGNIIHGQHVGTVELIGQYQAKRLDFTDIRYRFPVG